MGGKNDLLVDGDVSRAWPVEKSDTRERLDVCEGDSQYHNDSIMHIFILLYNI